MNEPKSDTIIIDNYVNALNNLKELIPEDYKKKEDIIRIINNSIDDIFYRPPEMLSYKFTEYCNLLIPYLPKNQNCWVKEPWQKILETAKINNQALKIKMKTYF